jgi:RNA polymerase sigma factor (TIGR02999 family)
MTEDHPTQEITRLLSAARNGDPVAADALYDRVYRELHRLAHRQLGAHGRPGDTLDTTALVHESYLRLAQPADLSAADRAHFFNLAARVMRNVVVDFARRRDAEKRGAALRVTWQEGMEAVAGEGSEVDLLALDTALTRLQAESPRLAQVVELRFFAGLSLEEIAGLLGVVERTLKRDWRKARAFLLAELQDHGMR